MNDQLVKRLKSFLWRAGMVAAAAFIAYVSENIGVLDLPVWAVGISGLVLGEISKLVHNVRHEGV
jgi:hypothetical protein